MRDLYTQDNTVILDLTGPNKMRLALRRAVSKCSCALFVLTVFAIILNISGNSRSLAQQPEIDQRHAYNVKAAFLYSFGRYVDWPESSFDQTGGNFTIGVVGQNPFAGALERIASTKTVHGRTITVQYFDTIEDYRPCQILFFPSSVPAR